MTHQKFARFAHHTRCLTVGRRALSRSLRFAFTFALILGLVSAGLRSPRLTTLAQERTRRTGGGATAQIGVVDDAPTRHRNFGTTLINSGNVLRPGTVLIVQMLTPLTSKSAQPSDRFRARVISPISDENGRTLIPLGSIVEGHVEEVERARTRRRSGLIFVGFDSLTIRDGSREGAVYDLQGELAPVTAEDRKRFDADGMLKPRNGNLKRTVAFVGGGAGAGALVGAVTAGAIFGAGVGAGVGAAAAYLAKGKEATIAPGDRFGVELTQSLRLDGTLLNRDERDANNTWPPRTPGRTTTGGRTGALDPYDDRNDPFTNDNRANPRTTPRTDPGDDYSNPYPLPPRNTGSGRTTTPPRTTGGNTSNLPPNPLPPRPVPTPRTRGNASSNQPTLPPTEVPADAGETRLLTLRNVLVQRSPGGDLHISLTGAAPSAGWQLAPTAKQEGETLRVELRGAPPRSLSAQVVTTQSKILIVPDPNREVRRVIVRGANGATMERSVLNNSSLGNPTRPTATTDGQITANAIRIADKLNALTGDVASYLNATRHPDGRITYEDTRMANSNEAQYLLALQRLDEAGDMFRQPLGASTRQEAIRRLLNGSAMVNRLVPLAQFPTDLMTRWQGVNRDINALANQAGVTSGSGVRPR